jgi:hypothetical protein
MRKTKDEAHATEVQGRIWMEKVCSFIGDARKRVTALVAIARWIWVVNSLVAIAGIAYHRYDVAALGGFTWMLSLVAAAVGIRATKYLATAERTMDTL